MDLYINTRGSYLHVKDKLFEIKVPDSEKKGAYTKHHIAAHKVRSIILSISSTLSTDAIMLALTNNIDIIISDWNGQPLGRFWHSKHGSTSRIRKAQLEASLNAEGLKWIRKWLRAKLNAQAELLRKLARHREKKREIIKECTHQIAEIEAKISRLKAQNIEDLAETLRGLEGTAGRVYFATLSHLMPARYPFRGRSMRPAHDPFNACLNYCYGVLYSKIEKALIIAGLDPYLGFLHRDDYNQKSMVFDFIEPYRPWADEVVFKLFSGKQMKNTYFKKMSNGISLNDDGKIVLITSYNKFFDETKIRYKGRNHNRHNIIQYDAHAFAKQLISKSN